MAHGAGAPLATLVSRYAGHLAIPRAGFGHTVSPVAGVGLGLAVAKRRRENDNRNKGSNGLKVHKAIISFGQA